MNRYETYVVNKILTRLFKERGIITKDDFPMLFGKSTPRVRTNSFFTEDNGNVKLLSGDLDAHVSYSIEWNAIFAHHVPVGYKDAKERFIKLLRYLRNDDALYPEIHTKCVIFKSKIRDALYDLVYDISDEERARWVDGRLYVVYDDETQRRIRKFSRAELVILQRHEVGEYKAPYEGLQDLMARRDNFTASSIISSKAEEMILSRFYEKVPAYVRPKDIISKGGYQISIMNKTCRSGDWGYDHRTTTIGRHISGNKLYKAELMNGTDVNRDGKVERTVKMAFTRMVDLEKGQIYAIYNYGKTRKYIRNITYYDSMIFAGSRRIDQHCSLGNFNEIEEEVRKKRKEDGFFIKDGQGLRHMVRMPNVTPRFFAAVSGYTPTRKIPVTVSGVGEACKIIGIPTSLGNDIMAGFVAELMSANTKKRKRITIDEAKSIAKAFGYKCASRSRCVPHYLLEDPEEISAGGNPFFSEDDATYEFHDRMQRQQALAKFLKLLLVSGGWTPKKLLNWVASTDREDETCLYDMYMAKDPSSVKLMRAAAKRTKNGKELHDEVVRLQIQREEDLRELKRLGIGLTKAEEAIRRLDARKFKYEEEKIAKFNQRVEEYEFFLAETRGQLKEIGQYMHHCVGGYGDRVAHNRSTIVAVKNASGSYVNCIEVQGDRIVQAKCKHNNYPEGDLRKAILDWAERLELKINCYDLTHSYSGMSY